MSRDGEQSLQMLWVPVKHIQASIASAWNNVPCHSEHYAAIHIMDEQPLFQVDYDKCQYSRAWS